MATTLLIACQDSTYKEPCLNVNARIRATKAHMTFDLMANARSNIAQASEDSGQLSGHSSRPLKNSTVESLKLPTFITFRIIISSPQRGIKLQRAPTTQQRKRAIEPWHLTGLLASLTILACSTKTVVLALLPIPIDMGTGPNVSCTVL